MSEWDPAAMYTREGVAMAGVYEALVYYDHESGEVEPRLATEWEVSEDGLTWTFALRDDVVFHSGNPMTAESVAAAIQRTIDLGLGAAYLWDPVAEVTAVGEFTVEFSLDYPASLERIAAAAYGAFIYEVPGAADPPDYVSAGEDSPFYGASRGTGPYTVAEYNPNQEYEITLGQHREYWGGWDGEQFESIEFRVVEEASTAAALLRQGEVHSVQALPAELLDDLRDEAGVQILEQVSFQNLLLFLNTLEPPLDDARVRRAIAHTINYDDLSEVVGGNLVPAQGMMPRGLFGAETGNQFPLHDPDTAEELLAEAGYDLDADSAEVELTVNSGDPDQQVVAELLQSQLAEINIIIDIIAMPYEQQAERARDADPAQRQDLLTGRWYPDAPEVHGWYASLFRTEDEPYYNFAGYSNSELDALIDEVPEATATDPEAALEIYAEMEQIVLEDMPVVVLGDAVYRRPVSADVGGFIDNPMYANSLWPHDLERAS